jgi:transposase
MKALVSDELWAIVEPLLPKHKPSAKGGRPRVGDRECLRGIIFVLRTGMPWEYLPRELGCGSGVTCWRRLRDWQEAGVWERLHAVLLEHLARAEKLDWSRAALDSRSLAAKKGGPSAARTRPTRAKRARSNTYWSRGAVFRSL